MHSPRPSLHAGLFNTPLRCSQPSAVILVTGGARRGIHARVVQILLTAEKTLLSTISCIVYFTLSLCYHTGTGLVGSAIAQIINDEPVGSRFGRKEGEEWVFAGSRDVDLRWAGASRRGVMEFWLSTRTCLEQKLRCDSCLFPKGQADACDSFSCTW